VIDDSRPIFIQIAEHIEDAIVQGTLDTGDQAPSVSELARFFRVNPATAVKGVGELVARGVLVKRRGVGMFVAPDARAAVTTARAAHFESSFVTPLLAEAAKLGIDRDRIIDMIADKGEDK
jgi:DNA-binding transcriptional regulator YhcF (GntR family)